MDKSPEAFRTISEVAEWLGTPTHVLRFWESRFTQVKPVKRAGGRRYYRPKDMALLGGIKKLLHEDGMTIRGVQRMLRNQGVRHVADQSPPLDVMAAGTASEAPMQVDVSPAAVDNIVPLSPKKSATPSEPERGPRGDILSDSDKDIPAFTRDASNNTPGKIQENPEPPIEAAPPPAAPEKKQPLGANIPSDDADDGPAPPGIVDVAASLRHAASGGGNKPLSAEAVSHLYTRLRKLRKRMKKADAGENTG